MKDLKSGELPGSTYGTRFGRAMGTVDDASKPIDADLWKQVAPLSGTEDISFFADLVLGLLYLAVADERRWNYIMAARGSRRLELVEPASLDQVPALSDLHRARGAFLATRAVRPGSGKSSNWSTEFNSRAAVLSSSGRGRAHALSHRSAGGGADRSRVRGQRTRPPLRIRRVPRLRSQIHRRAGRSRGRCFVHWSCPLPSGPRH